MNSKRYAAEVVGTFGIVFPPVAFSSHGGEGGLLSAALISGLCVSGMIYALGPISAAHFNPAVTLGFASAGRFPWRHVPAYIGCQFLGGTLAALVAGWLLKFGGGTHVPAPRLGGQLAGIEIAITFLLMLVIIAVATDRRVNSTVPALAIGAAVVVGVLIGGPITGGSMNPARSVGPALFAGGKAMENLWLYLIAPPIGAVLAAQIYERLRLDVGEATGAPNELLIALDEIKREH